MNPDIEDPNNHVPAVSPDDDWDAADVEPVVDAQLPPRRADASKLSRKDVNLSGFKSIESAHLGKTAAVPNETVFSRSPVSVNIRAEPKDIGEKEDFDFKPGLALEDMKMGEAAASVRQRPVIPSRFNVGERDDWGAAQKKVSARWMLYTALGVVLLVVVTVSWSYFNRARTEEDQIGRADDPPTPVEKGGDKDFEQSAMGRLTKSKQEAMRIYASYVKAKDVSEIAGLIYLADRNMPVVSNHWKPVEVAEEWMPSEMSSWKTYQDGPLMAGELKGTNHDFSGFLAVFRYENSVLKMDWKATTGYGSANFEDLKIGKGVGNEIRGWMESSSFYTQELPDDRYRSFILKSPEKDFSIWVYTEIGSEIDSKVVGLFEVSPITGEFKTEARVILNLDRGKESILPRQWMIKELIAENWLDQAEP